MGEHAVRPSADAVNAALFCDIGNTGFLEAALDHVSRQPVLLVSNDERTMPLTGRHRLLAFADVGLGEADLDESAILSAILAKCADARMILVDMNWIMLNRDSMAAVETWGRVVERLHDVHGLGIVSIYDKLLLIENHLQTVVHSHRQFLSPSGLHDNPQWMPTRLSGSGTVDEQLAFLVGRVVPDYARDGIFSSAGRPHARGAEPDWLPKTNRVGTAAPAARWHIYCLGKLRVTLGGRTAVDWTIPGGSPKKMRSLFAYLLQSGEKGARAERIAELLWPEEQDEQVKRARLHHAVASLRKAFGQRDCIIRTGDYYRLNAPPGSWIDISSFEQLCRHAISLAREGREEDMLKALISAAELYDGDLFEDLPQEVVHSEFENWCLPKRIWLREMKLKVERYIAMVLRKQGRMREALEHCNRALDIEPACEISNAEALRVYHAQGRFDAMARQYRQYQSAAGALSDEDDNTELRELYRELVASPPRHSGTQRKTIEPRLP